MSMWQKRKQKKTNSYQYEEIPMNRPKIVPKYSKMMKGVDQFDQNMKYYHFYRKTSKWSTKMIFYLLQALLQNAFTLYNKFSKDTKKYTHLEFQMVAMRAFIEFDPEKWTENPNIVLKPTEKLPEASRLFSPSKVKQLPVSRRRNGIPITAHNTTTLTVPRYGPEPPTSIPVHDAHVVTIGANTPASTSMAVPELVVTTHLATTAGSETMVSVHEHIPCVSTLGTFVTTPTNAMSTPSAIMPEIDGAAGTPVTTTLATTLSENDSPAIIPARGASLSSANVPVLPAVSGQSLQMNNTNAEPIEIRLDQPPHKKRRMRVVDPLCRLDKTLSHRLELFTKKLSDRKKCRVCFLKDKKRAYVNRHCRICKIPLCNWDIRGCYDTYHELSDKDIRSWKEK